MANSMRNLLGISGNTGRDTSGWKSVAKVATQEMEGGI
jgi:hypothetical protein